MSINVIDIIQEVKYQDMLLDAFKDIESDPHHNTQNYKNFFERLPSYDAFHIVLNDGVLVACSGLYNNGIYPNSIVRALDRTYYFNWRSSNPWERKSLNSRYATEFMWPKQVELAENLGYKGIFFSMQTLATRRAIKWTVDYMTKYKPMLLPKLYNTCRLVNNCVNQDKECWQNIAMYNFTTGFEFPLPSLEISNYEK
jgi:hypothetical protein